MTDILKRLRIAIVNFPLTSWWTAALVIQGWIALYRPQLGDDPITDLLLLYPYGWMGIVMYPYDLIYTYLGHGQFAWWHVQVAIVASGLAACALDTAFLLWRRKRSHLLPFPSQVLPAASLAGLEAAEFLSPSEPHQVKIPRDGKSS